MKKPDWFKVKLNTNENFRNLKKIKNDAKLHTVCEEAKCPNIHECWSEHKTATFMVLGDICTRRCRFCSVKTGQPDEVDLLEPARLAESVYKMDLEYVVITMSTRDDLKDGGAFVISQCVEQIKKLKPKMRVEVLTSEFNLNMDAIKTVVSSAPDIISHNIETVKRLTPSIRSRVTYDDSLTFFDYVYQLNPKAILKSSMMLGLGETEDEIIETMKDLLAHKVYLLNLGQYLQPTKNQVIVQKYYHPNEFEKLKNIALEMGFVKVFAAPLVRSSYHAQEQYEDYLLNIVESEDSLKYENDRKNIHPLFKDEG